MNKGDFQSMKVGELKFKIDKDEIENICINNYGSNSYNDFC